MALLFSVERIYYSKETGTVFSVPQELYDVIERYKEQPKKLRKTIKPYFDDYVNRKKRGLTR